MANEIGSKRAFQEDIFAEEPERFWSVKTKASCSGINYDTHTNEVKSDSSCSSSDDENGFILRGDSDSFKGVSRKQGSSSTSEGANQEVASSPHPPRIISRERLLSCFFDDDAQSGNVSGHFEKKDLAFKSSFENYSKNKQSPNFRTEDKSERLPSFSMERFMNGSNNEGKLPLKKKDYDNKLKKSGSDERSSRCWSPDKKSMYSRSRSKSHDRRSSSRRSSSPTRGKDKRTRSPYRPASRSRDRRSDRERRRSPRRRRSHSRDSRRHSRSRSYERHRSSRHASSGHDKYHRKRYSRSRSHSRDRSKGYNNRKPGSLPLSTSGGAVTPQMALAKTMAVMNAKAQAITGVPLPTYYNPTAVNPIKYAEQVHKRKLLWLPKDKNKNEEQPKNSVWNNTTFAQDQDGKMTAKFRKLMGIKSTDTEVPPPSESEDSVIKRQEELFQDLDKQYETARMVTHTQRGLGLGYSQTLYPPIQK
ncbi:hypothetical protein CDAR_6092 [Caerostris darwini]|uniref:Small acidic protein-like domain-containing protein n=1 Tax=Caerostris darwini TaxID=1538125 RepID=A0AAV4SH44_9ARAC|nr:hypothetical protein CDAR_6092 [Caerostris darwini]